MLFYRSPPRTRRSSASSSSSGHCPGDSHNRSRSPTPRREREPKSSLQPPKYVSTYQFNTSTRHRSASPSPAVLNRRSRSPMAPQRRPSNYTQRDRSRSPAVTTLSPASNTRARSRSPAPNTLRPNERYSRSRSPNLKVSTHSYDSPTAASRNRSKSPSANMEIEKTPVKCRAEVVDTQNSAGDSGSEVSDEGYRSLGVVVSSPIVGESKIVIQTCGQLTKSKSLHKTIN